MNHRQCLRFKEIYLSHMYDTSVCNQQLDTYKISSLIVVTLSLNPTFE